MCICPEGFGGPTCTERQLGTVGALFRNRCGKTIDASPEWQTLQVDVPAPKGIGPYTTPDPYKISIQAACCHYWIKGNGKRVMLQFDSVTPGSEHECRNACDFGATEVKYGDWTKGGARVCCPQHAQEFGTAVSAGDLIIVRVCSLRNTQSAVVRFRTTDDYGPPEAVVVTASQPTIPKHQPETVAV
ncbi:metalloproteinase [Aphelenchoides avenae]|nr:metalloproteinase [Aphelenchus avenae]